MKIKKKRFTNKIKVLIMLVLTVVLTVPLFSNDIKAYESGNKVFGSIVYQPTEWGALQGFETIRIETDLGRLESLSTALIDFNIYFGSKSTVYYIITEGSILTNNLGTVLWNIASGYVLEINNTDLILRDNNFNILVSYNSTNPQVTDYHILIAKSIDTEAMNAYSRGLSEGYLDGREMFGLLVNGVWTKAVDAYNTGRAEYGVYYNGQWYNAEDFGAIRYNDGLLASQTEAYNKGYLDGGNDSFTANIKDWIVPAIIVVLFGGGFLYFASRRRE